jgi:hypothetical protein
MSLILHNKEQLILNKSVLAGTGVNAVVKLNHNYPALIDQAKMMITGKFNIANAWYYKANTDSYTDDGQQLKDYSGNDNDVELIGANALRIQGGYRYSPGDMTLGSQRTIAFWFKAHTGTSYTDLPILGVLDYTRFVALTRLHYSSGSNLFYMDGLGSYSNKYVRFHKGYFNNLLDWTFVSIQYDDTSVRVLFSNIGGTANEVETQTITSASRTYKILFAVNHTAYVPIGDYSFAGLWMYNSCLTNDQVEELRDFGTVNSVSPAYQFTFADDNKAYEVVNGNAFNPYQYCTPSSLDVEYDEDFKLFYNLKNGFTETGGGGIPYDLSGNPIAISGVNKPAGNWHNGCETKIDLGSYGEKTSEEIKTLAESDSRVEHSETANGSIKELKITKLTDEDTEHYTEDNNTTQILEESGNLTSPIDQTIKLRIQGGDNDNSTAEKTLTFTSGAELTVTAAISGEDGNNINLVFEQGTARQITVDEDSTITITLIFESGDDLTDCITELDSVDELISYTIDIHGAIDERSGSLENGFTPKLTISQVTFQGNNLFGLDLSSSLYKTYIRQADTYSRPETAEDWETFLGTFTRVGPMELKGVKALIEPDTVDTSETGSTDVYLWAAKFSGIDLNCTPENTEAYTAWDNEYCDILIVKENSGMAVVVLNTILQVIENHVGGKDHIELRTEKIDEDKDVLRDFFEIPE